MDRVFQKANDLRVANRYVYANDEKAYLTSQHSKMFDAEELKEAFIKGCVVVDGGAFYQPISCAYDNATRKTTLTYTKVDADEETTAVLATVVSKD